MKNINKNLIVYKIFLIMLIIAGIIIFAIIFKKQYNDQVYDKENDEVTKNFHELQETQNQEQPIELQMQGHKVIGIIKIPAIDLEYPIIDKTTKETMRISISKFSGGEINEIGNVALAGHNNYSGTMFGKNKNLKIKDKIYLTDLTRRTIEYEIYNIFVTDPNDTSILETEDKTKRELTLITCKNGRSERLIIKARENTV
jgi:sortase A